jgi:hypothetical protein
MNTEEVEEAKDNIINALQEMSEYVSDDVTPMSITELREYIRWMTGHLNQIVAEI